MEGGDDKGQVDAMVEVALLDLAISKAKLAEAGVVLGLLVRQATVWSNVRRSE